MQNEGISHITESLKLMIKFLFFLLTGLQTLFTSIKGMTADRGALARVMVSRAEMDMDEIQRVFKIKYGVELREAICDSIPSGDYRDFLLALATKTATTPSKA